MLLPSFYRHSFDEHTWVTERNQPSGKSPGEASIVLLPLLRPGRCGHWVRFERGEIPLEFDFGGEPT
jgi:hypothetical protein